MHIEIQWKRKDAPKSPSWERSLLAYEQSTNNQQATLTKRKGKKLQLESGNFTIKSTHLKKIRSFNW